MPMSAYHCLPYVLELLITARPARVLDAGAGFGKYGFLLREYLDVMDVIEHRALRMLTGRRVWAPPSLGS